MYTSPSLRGAWWKGCSTSDATTSSPGFASIWVWALVRLVMGASRSLRLPATPHRNPD